MARFAERKEVNRHVRVTHPTEAVTLVGGKRTGPGPNVPLGNINCADGRRQRRAPAGGVISTPGQRTVSSEGTLPCTVAGCSRVFKTKGWLARHIKSNHSALAVAEHSNTPPTVQVAVVKPVPPEPVVLGACRRRHGAGERNNLLVVGAGQTQGPVNQNPVQLIGDEECG